jgi:prolyl 4-hydroxylase
LEKLHDSKITALEQRIASMLGCWIHQIEPLQLVRYKPGQFFGVHHDMGDLLENDSVLLPKKNIHVKRRLVTLFIYLNSLEKEQGGCTYFPKCNIRVQPQRGRLVIWSNTTKEGLPEPRTIHAGEPVRSEDENFIKYGLNIWICEE